MIEEPTPMALCPMAETCKGMVEKPLAVLLLIILGFALIVVGVLIVVDPKILVWLAAGASMLMGVVVLMLAGFVRKVGERFRSAPSQASN